MRHTLQTVAENEALSEAEKLERLKKAKGGTWYDGWQPYCVQSQIECNSRLTRMQRMPYGFRCPYCGNMIGWDLTRLKESPINQIIKW